MLEEGAAFASSALVERLHQLHYHPAEGTLIHGTFTHGKGKIEVFRRRFLTPRGPAGGNRLDISIRGGRINSLQVAGRAVRLAYLDPPLIASYYGADLRERRPIRVDGLP
jgi:hypothetical protein